MLLIGLLGIGVILVVLGYLLPHDDIFDDNNFLIRAFGWAVLIIIPITWFASYFDIKSDIQAFRMVQVTVDASREENISPLERVTLTREIIEQNSWLANVQYLNNTIFDPWIPDEVEKLKPIK